MEFDHKAILKSDNIEKINGSIEKRYKNKIDVCDTIINHFRLIDKLQNEIEVLYNQNKNIEKEYLESKDCTKDCAIKNNKKMRYEIANIIKYKKDLRDYHRIKIKELKKTHLK